MNVEHPILKSWEVLNPHTGQIIRKKPGQCSPGWAYDTSTQHVTRMNCKRRTCPVCGWYWRHKWRKALQEKAHCDEFTQNIKPRLALTLTTAQATNYKQMWNCLRYFWQILRSEYPKTEYWGVVEVNQKHSLIHLHFLLAGYAFIPYEKIRECWQTAQRWAKFESIAFVERIEKIRKNVEAYFTKYLTKAAGGIKDEIPTKEDWQGRHIRYSKGFFGVPIAAMCAASKLKTELSNEEQFSRMVYNVRKPLASLSGFLEKSDYEAAKIESLVNRKHYFYKPPGSVKITLDIYDIASYDLMWAKKEWPVLTEVL